MSDMRDTITITGNLAADPELRRTPGGVAIATFRVGSKQWRYDRAAGTWVDDGTNWYTVSAFRALADHAFASLRKGDRVLVSGRLRLRAWETETKKGLAVEIDADAVGHDLRWGTTTFVKDDRRAPGSGQEGSSGDWAVESADDWAAPGVDTAGLGSPGGVRSGAATEPKSLSDAPSAAHAPGGPSTRELVTADAETPF